MLKQKAKSLIYTAKGGRMDQKSLWAIEGIEELKVKVGDEGGSKD